MNNKIRTKMDKYNKEDKKTVPVYVKYGLVALAVIVAIVAGLLIYLNVAGGYVAKVDGEKIGTGEFKYYLAVQKNSMLKQAQSIDPNITDATFWSTNIGGENALAVAKKNTLESLRELKIQLIKAKEKKITLKSEDIKVVDDNIKKNIIDKMGPGRLKADKAFKEQYNVSIDEIRNMQLEISIVRKFQADEMKNAKITADQIKTYYDKNPEWYKEDTQMRFGAEEAVWARHILINVAADATQEVKDAAKKKAEDLLAKIKAGEDFASLAKANSEDPGSAQYGGDYVFGKGRMVPEFETAAFSLNPGQLYDTLVKTDYGYHIVKLEEKYAKDQPVSLKCATEYWEYGGKTFIEYQLYKKQLENWKKDKKYDPVKNTSVYDSTNG